MDQTNNNSFLINTIVTTVLLGGAVTMVMVPDLKIFTPSPAEQTTYIDGDIEDAHFVAPDMTDIIEIAQSGLVLGDHGINDIEASSTKPEQPKKRVKQPGTYYRCVNPINGRPIEHGKSITVYEKSNVTFPEVCKQEVRRCDNGAMLGSYTESSCIQSGEGCIGPDGRNYSHGSVGTYYLHNEVIGKPEDGEDICTRQARVCQGGAWYLFDRTTQSNFDYKYSYCNVKLQ